MSEDPGVDWAVLHDAAVDVMRRAYAPYSRFSLLSTHTDAFKIRTDHFPAPT